MADELDIETDEDGYPIKRVPFGYSSQIDSIERYGITWDKYHTLLSAQRDSCAICERHPTSAGPLQVDHDHASGEVRGLLCHGCNTGLGLFNDDPDTLRKASTYLWERGCWVTHGQPEEQEMLAEYTIPPHEYAVQLRAQAERGWLPALRHVYACYIGEKKTQTLDEAWTHFWSIFRSCVWHYDHKERVVLRARDAWVELGGAASDFRPP